MAQEEFSSQCLNDLIVALLAEPMTVGEIMDALKAKHQNWHTAPRFGMLGKEMLLTPHLQHRLKRLKDLARIEHIEVVKGTGKGKWKAL